MLLRYTLAFFLIGLLWEVASRAAGEALLPSPVTTALLFFQSLADPVYIGHMIVSLKRLICGLLGNKKIIDLLLLTIDCRLKSLHLRFVRLN